MHPNAQLIQRFYDSFGRRDADGMIACYDGGVEFSDAVFVDLNAAEARAMWRMLCGRAADLRVAAANIVADERRGSADWVADYTFSASGRPVHNVIHAEFEFADGLIVRHRDSFDLWRWSGMALGPTGKLLGWLPPFQAKLRAKARAGLATYMRGGKT
jgi:ketosteroid isomerase-like protein